MSLAWTAPRRALIFTACTALAAGLAVSEPVAGGSPVAEAAAASPCGSVVKSLVKKSGQRFAAGSALKRYAARVDYPVGTTYDQAAKVVLAKYGAGVSPTLVNQKIGGLQDTGDAVKAQQPNAVAAVNGDFFRQPKIRGKRMEIARGAMVRNGRIIRSDRARTRVVGVDKTGKPFGGLFAARGYIKRGTSPAVKVQGINWQRIQGGGVTLYTTDWRASTSTPRPAGAAEWVINGRNEITTVRSPSSGSLGAQVASGTRVVAFSKNFTLAAAAGRVGDKVNVHIRQSTDSGVKLRTAIGRGLPLVDKGVAAPLGCDAYSHSKAARPRTVVGWTKAGNWRTLTVPGKAFKNCPICLREGGFALANVGAIAKKLGFWKAYELDGGGSTTLYTRSNGGKWSRRDLWGLNTATGTYERSVSNALAFMGP